MIGKQIILPLRVLSLLICFLCSGFAFAQIPAKVDLALRQAALPRDALSVVVIPLGAGAAKPARQGSRRRRRHEEPE